jgi:hypothetical protein
LLRIYQQRSLSNCLYVVTYTYGIDNLINYIIFSVRVAANQQQQHLKTNNIISKLANIVLSILLLTGISAILQFNLEYTATTAEITTTTTKQRTNSKPRVRDTSYIFFISRNNRE